MPARKPLNTSTNEIHLLELASRDSSAVIACRLKTATLQDEPEYEALSYVWGSRTDNLEEIILDGAPHFVTKNLYEALTALRHRDKARTLWVDALCINQADHRERSHQVGIMGTIYAGALQVLVWLCNDGFPYNFRRKIQQFCQSSADPATPPWENEDADLYTCDYEDLLELRRFLRKQWAWWLRAWTFQEAVLGAELLLHAGAESFTIDELEFYADTYRTHAQRSHLVPRDARAYQNVAALREARYRLRRGQKYELLELFTENYHRRATDPRDRFYAYVGLARNVPPEFVRYDLPLRDWLVHVTFQVMRQSRGALEVVRYVPASRDKSLLPDDLPKTEPGDGSFNMEDLLSDMKDLSVDTKDLPSWCPDWTLGLSRMSGKPVWANRFSSGGRKPGHVSFHAPGALGVTGVFCDTVARVGHMSDDRDELDPEHFRRWCSLVFDSHLARSPAADGAEATDTNTTENEVPLWTRLGAYTYPYTHHDSLQRALRRTLTGDNLQMDEPAFARFWETWIEGQQQQQQQQHGRRRTSQSDAATFSCALQFWAQRQRPLVSARGYIGWGPRDTRAGDVVAVMYGAEMAWVLRERPGSCREAGTETIECTLVGEAYVHGLMYGEAVRAVKEGKLQERRFRIH